MMAIYINGSENGFIENIYDREILIKYCKIQGTNENVLIFRPYANLISLIVWSPSCSDSAFHGGSERSKMVCANKVNG
jgi:hypothetical protein